MTVSSAIGDKISLAALNLLGVNPNGRNLGSGGPNYNSPFNGPNFNSFPLNRPIPNSVSLDGPNIMAYNSPNMDLGLNSIPKPLGLISIANFGMPRPEIPRSPIFGSLGGKPVRSSLIVNSINPAASKSLGGVGGQEIRFFNTGLGDMRNPSLGALPGPAYPSYPRYPAGGINVIKASDFQDVEELSSFGL